MTFSALVFTFSMLGFTIALAVQQIWPRDEDGNFLDIEEVSKFQERFPKDNSNSEGMIILTFLTIAVISVVISHG